MNPLLTTGLDAHRGTTSLSVNVNKVALLRNTRELGIPSVLRAATFALEAGANGITVHPRPDERHIRRHDVYELAELMRQWPQAEYNIEGNPFHNLMELVRDLVAQGLPVHQVTFVPDSVEQSTSDHGWQFPQDAERLAPLIAEARDLGVRVSLFMDPQPEAMAAVCAPTVSSSTPRVSRARTLPGGPSACCRPSPRPRTPRCARGSVSTPATT
jgi:pyridoxine 5-phosphate synthase